MPEVFGSTTPMLIMAGFVAGLFGSLLGLGGGWLMVPVLASIGVSTTTSVGTSLAAIVCTTSVSVFKYYRKGHLQMKLGLAFGIPAAGGVQLGKETLHLLETLGIDALAVGGVYAGLLLFIGTGMLRRSLKKTPDEGATRRWHLPFFGPSILLDGGASLALYQSTLGGMMAGMLSGVLGIGGGIVLVPLMTGLFGLPVVTAVATSLIAVLFSAFAGAVSYTLAGDVHEAAALALAIGAVAGGYLGATLAPYAKENSLRLLFAALAYTTASSVVIRLAGHPDASQALLFGSAAVLGALSLGMLLRATYRARRST